MAKTTSTKTKATRPAKASKGQFNHSENSIFDACSVNEKELEKKIDAYNKKMKKDGTYEKVSERVELLTEVFTPTELAILFALQQMNSGVKSFFGQLAASLKD